MKLSTLLEFNDIVIQLHDNPDADAVGSGFAIYKYLEHYGKKPRLVYSGQNKISKSNMVLFVDTLKIPVEYVTTLEKPELLITVDCQYGEGNVTHFEADNIAMIDHHNTGRNSDAMAEIRSHLVSCSTICYDMMLEENFDINGDRDLATALYYGLYMDSNGFSEIRHPLDHDMIDSLRADRSFIKKLMHSNFSIKELETAGIAMIRYNLDEVRHVSIIKANPCDPNILGIIGDMVLQVDIVDVCIVYNECPGGYKLSIRSCVDTVAANDLSAFLTTGIGNGGGHNDKAGGFINEERFHKSHPEMNIENYFYNKIQEYYDTFTIIYAKDGLSSKDGFDVYYKKSYICGYVKTTEICEAGHSIKVRTLEGDVHIDVNDSTYLMVGSSDEIYPISKSVFDKRYSPLNSPYTHEFEYTPKVYDTTNNESKSLIDLIHSCQSLERTKIYAKKLDKPVKVFTRWNYEKYMLGEIDDYLCYSASDENDIYVVNKDVLNTIYEKE